MEAGNYLINFLRFSSKNIITYSNEGEVIGEEEHSTQKRLNQFGWDWNGTTINHLFSWGVEWQRAGPKPVSFYLPSAARSGPAVTFSSRPPFLTSSHLFICPSRSLWRVPPRGKMEQRCVLRRLVSHAYWLLGCLYRVSPLMVIDTGMSLVKRGHKLFNLHILTTAWSLEQLKRPTQVLRLPTSRSQE